MPEYVHHPEDMGWVKIEDGLSNFDSSVPDGLAEKLKAPDTYCDYAGWNFHATVRWHNDQFIARVMTWGCYRSTIIADSLEDLMREVSTQYGFD